MVVAECQSCGKKYTVPDQYAGRKLKCKVCSGIVSTATSAASSAPIESEDAKAPAVSAEVKGNEKSAPAQPKGSKANSAPVEQKKPANGSRRKIGGIVVGAVALAIVGVGLAYWGGYLHSGSATPASPQPVVAAPNPEIVKRLNESLAAITRSEADLDTDAGPLKKPTLTSSGQFSADNRIVAKLLKTYPQGKGQIVAMSEVGESVALQWPASGGRTVIAKDDQPPAPALLSDSTGDGPTFSFDAIFSPDGKRLAWLAELKPPGGFAVILDGAIGPAYRSIRGMAFSPDSSRFAYVAEKSAGQFLVVVDGKEKRAFDDISTDQVDKQHTYGSKQHRGQAIHFSADSKHTAWVGIRKSPVGLSTEASDEMVDAYVVFDDVETKVVSAKRSEMQLGSIALSGNGLRRAYIATIQSRAVPATRKAMVMIDQKAPKTHSYAMALKFSADGSRLAYLACDNADGDMGPPWTVIDEAAPGKPYNYIDPQSIRLSSGGRHLVYRAFTASASGNSNEWNPSGKKVGHGLVVIDGREMPDHTAVLFTSDGTHVAEVVPTDTSTASSFDVFIDQSKVTSMQGVSDLPQISQSGHHVAMAVLSDDGSKEGAIAVDNAAPKKLSGTCYRLNFVTDDTLHVLTAASDGVLRLLELRVVGK